MSAFSNVLRKLGSWFSVKPSKYSTHTATAHDPTLTLNTDATESDSIPNTNAAVDSDIAVFSRKRTSPSLSRHSRKRMRLSQELRTCNPSQDPNDHSPKQRPVPKLCRDAVDRELMPPPSTPKMAIQKRFTTANDADESEYSFIPISSPKSHQAITMDEYDMEQARRYAAAVSLPENSGIWAPAEQQLFYHLALRGFEPILPHNWMIDFPTLPLSLYNDEFSASPPLVRNLKTSEFRAIRALRELIDTGKHVRDRKLSSPGNRVEKVVQDAISRYINWSFHDAGSIETQSDLPIYTVVTLRKGQSTAVAIEQLASQLHHLAAAHRYRRGIHASIETPEILENQHSVTQVVEDNNCLPILTGLLITSSIVAVFSFNAHHSSPETGHIPASTSQPDRDTIVIDLSSQPLESTPPTFSKSTTASFESGLRFISTFDFSNAAQDVWNAIAMAIVTMHIRQMMLLSVQQLSGFNAFPELSRFGSDSSQVISDSSPLSSLLTNSHLMPTAVSHQGQECMKMEDMGEVVERSQIQVLDPDL